MSQSEFELYGWNTPNGQKIIIALEEVNADYTYVPIDISKGEQSTAAFKRLSPDGKIPALAHHCQTPVTLFESGAILLYLANRYPALNGQTEQEKAQVMAWTFWQVGQLGPLIGQFGRFHIAEPSNPAAVAHFEQLIWRCLDVMENRLQQSTFLAGEQFTVADITSLPWIASNQSYLQKYNINWQKNCPAVDRWVTLCSEKPSVSYAFSQ